MRGVGTLLARFGDAPRPAGPPDSGWLAVTIARPTGEVEAAELPGPLAVLADQLEVRVRPAPGGEETELAVRLPSSPTSSGPAVRFTGADQLGELRSALRQAKQLLEVGEVLAVDPTPHGRRTATPGGALLETWTSVAGRGGVR
jgi:hypothetical protein